MKFVNPFNAVGREEYDALSARLGEMERERDDARREGAALRIEVGREVKNAERLTELCARAVRSAEILEQALIERQIGKERDPSLVLVVNNLPEAPQRRGGYVPLHRRRRLAVRREEEEQLRRNALPKLRAELPEIPLTGEDREAMREAIAELSHHHQVVHHQE
jgi:hypothetical protein